MTRVLLTGGSGFIALHVLRTLLERGHSVVTTVRNQTKAEEVKAVFPGYSNDALSFVFVPDVGKLNAFDDVVQSSPPFEAVIHTASPFSFSVADVQQDLLDPALNGTINILHAIKKSASYVKRVVGIIRNYEMFNQ
ncbi:Ketoreductase azaE [Colletotrichum sp. SAR11_239]|nr:Ketoreductase azaE [Colletotrichum sp. SAR11_239]